LLSINFDSKKWFFCIYTKTREESSGQQTHQDDDIYGMADDDPEEKRVRRSDHKSGDALFSGGQALNEEEEEPDVEEDEALDGDATVRSSFAAIPSSRALPPPAKANLKPKLPAVQQGGKKTLAQTTLASFAKPPTKTSTGASMSSAAAMAFTIPSTVPNESSSIADNLVGIAEDAIVMSSSMKTRDEIELQCKDDATGDRPAGAMFKTVKKEERDEFETEDGVITIFSPPQKQQ
jgi:hypothetical protein